MSEILKSMSHVDKLNAIAQMAKHLHDQAAGLEEAAEPEDAAAVNNASSESEPSMKKNSPKPKNKSAQGGIRG